MSAQNMEPIDEFAPASPGIDEGWHRVTYTKAFETNGQYGKQNVHILELIDIPGESIRVYTDPRMSKNSPQRQLLEAFLGQELGEGEQVTPRMVKGKDAEGFVEMSERSGKPKMTRFRPSRQQPAPPPVGAAPGRPLPPRPASRNSMEQDHPALLSEEQQRRIFELQTEIGYDVATLNNWIGSVYANRTVETLTPLEAADIIAQLEKPF